MAKTRPEKKKKSKRRGRIEHGSVKHSPEYAQQLMAQATEHLHTGQPQEALVLAQKAFDCLDGAQKISVAHLPVLALLAEIHVELGDLEQARKAFTQAAHLDPQGDLPDEEGGGADKFLWLAQLCEEGGRESVMWFDKGAQVLRKKIAVAEERERKAAEDEAALLMKKRNLANALCGAAEVYMTDLSWEEDAEARCEVLVTEACLVAPNFPEPLQTLASVRISQTRFEEARSALSRSLEMWNDLPPEDPQVPDFPTRISLSRLLMEVEMEDKALEVLERLVTEDDSSVEAWYLGGWGLYLIAQKQSQINEHGDGKITDIDDDTRLKLLKGSLDWLRNSLNLYKTQGYEDERLKEHAEELVTELSEKLGSQVDEEDEEEEWEDENGSEEDQEEDEDEVLSNT